MKKAIGIAGSGFAGAVVARQLAESGFKISLFEERNHLAGNSHTEEDSETGIMVHKYGPHIFNTSRKDVWEYINKFGEFIYYTNRVKAITNAGVFSLPINLLTINQFFKKTFNPREAQIFIENLGDKSILEPQNFEEQALKFLGKDLYENFFYGYTKKQWGVEPNKLPASILKRLPIRFNYDDNYYSQTYQGIPKDGYTAIITKMLDHPNIEIIFAKLTPSNKKEFDHIFYSGSLDGYFNYAFGFLNYRTLTFEKNSCLGDFQGNPVINYCDESIPFTRISEHKHFTPWKEFSKSLYFLEFSKLAKQEDTPFYPMRLSEDKKILEKYVELSQEETGVTFIGRLGTYRYLDMHVVIGESLDLVNKCLELGKNNYHLWPKFSGNPLNT